MDTIISKKDQNNFGGNVHVTAERQSNKEHTEGKRVSPPGRVLERLQRD
jgi:hypothetical protein